MTSTERTALRTVSLEWVGQQHYGFMDVTYRVGSQHRLVRLDQPDMVLAWNIAVVHDHELVPVYVRAEPDLPDTPPRERTSNGRAPQTLIDRHVIDVGLPAQEFADAFPSFHALFPHCVHGDLTDTDQAAAPSALEQRRARNRPRRGAYTSLHPPLRQEN